jgi:hypothetical protein
VSDLTSAERENIEHSLGLRAHEPKRKKSHRNHFVTGEGSTDWPVMMALVEKGFAKRRRGTPMSGGDDVFFITDAGIDAAGLTKRVRSEDRIKP